VTEVTHEVYGEHDPDPAAHRHTYHAVHHDGKGVSWLQVSHTPSDRYGATTHKIDLTTKDPTGAVRYHTLRRDSDGAVVDHRGDKLPPMSEGLMRQIENHHIKYQDSGAWMGLLDKVLDEYPHFAPAVEAHTAARFT